MPQEPQNRAFMLILVPQDGHVFDLEITLVTRRYIKRFPGVLNKAKKPQSHFLSPRREASRNTQMPCANNTTAKIIHTKNGTLLKTSKSSIRFMPPQSHSGQKEKQYGGRYYKQYLKPDKNGRPSSAEKIQNKNQK